MFDVGQSISEKFRPEKALYDPERDGLIEAKGDTSVIRAMIRQADNVEKGIEDPNIRVMVFSPGGGMSGVVTGGVSTALVEKKVTNGIRAIVAGSSAAHAFAGALSGEPRRLLSIFSEECTDKDLKFFNLRRLPEGKGMNIHMLSQLYNGEFGRKSMNTKNIISARPAFDVMMTEYFSGEHRLRNGKTPDVINSLEASAAAGPLYTSPVFVEGERCGDGCACAHGSVKEALAKYNPTHILIVTNCPEQARKEPAVITFLDGLLSSVHLPGPYRNGWLKRGKSLRKAMKLIRKSGVPTLTIAGDLGVSPLTFDKPKVERAGVVAARFMSELIDKERRTLSGNTTRERRISIPGYYQVEY